MTIYGFSWNGKKWELSEMTDTGQKGFRRWECQTVMTGTKTKIMAECERRNRAVAEARKNGKS